MTSEKEWLGYQSPRENNRSDEVTRLEVIDANGRSYTNWKVNHLEFSYQDDGKTLKIFVKE